MTQKETLEALLREIQHIKSHMPNGELKAMEASMCSMKEDISDLKKKLLNPDDGVIVNTNKNTSFRRRIEREELDFKNKMIELESLKQWKSGVNKALWIIFSLLAAVIVKVVIPH